MKEFLQKNNIKIKDGNIYYRNPKKEKDVVRPLEVKIDTIHEKMKKINYTEEYAKYKYSKTNRMENARMYPFAYIYYYYFAKKQTIPTPKEFIDEYIEMFCEKQTNGNYKFNNEYSTQIEFTYEELASRMLRSYNSFNREIEFMLNLIDKSTKFDIEYDLCRDLFDGIDLVITYQDKVYGVAEYVDTGRSKAFKNKKNTTRHDYSNFEMIDVTAKMSGDECNVVEYGDIYCYSNQVVYDLENDIKSRDYKIKDDFER